MKSPEIDKLFEGATAVTFYGEDCLEGVEVRLIVSKDKPASVSGTLSETIAILGLDERARQELVRRILEAMLSEKEDQFPHLGWKRWVGALAAAWAVELQDNMVPLVIQRTTRAMLAEARSLEEFVPALMPEAERKHGAGRVPYALVDMKVFSRESLIETWALGLIARRRDGERPAALFPLIFSFDLFGHKLENAPEPIRLLVREVMTTEILRLCAGHGVFESGEFSLASRDDSKGLFGLIYREPEEWRIGTLRKVVEPALVNALANGFIVSVSFLLERMGSMLRLFDPAARENRWWEEGATRTLAGLAAKEAENRGRYGIASALFELARKPEDAGRCREIAHSVGQWVELDYSFKFELA